MTPDRLAEIRGHLSVGENANPSCQGCNEHVLLALVDRLTADLAALTAAGIEPSAEKALKTSAEAYRLVEEARQMRSERDALAADLAAERGRSEKLREALLALSGGGLSAPCWCGRLPHISECEQAHDALADDDARRDGTEG